MKEKGHHGPVVGERGALHGSPFDDDLHKHGHEVGGKHSGRVEREGGKVFSGHEGQHEHKRGHKE